MARRIEHAGIVDRIEPGKVYVRIEVNEACSACRIRETCSLGGSTEKIVEVETPEADSFNAADRVTVCIDRRSGARSVVLAYLVPLAVLLAGLIVPVAAGSSEGAAALIAIGAVGVYYLLLYLLRHKIGNTIQFTLTKQ